MRFIDYFQSYIHYLVHPFKTHDSFLGKDTNFTSFPIKMSVYESLGTSWIFVVFNGIARIFLINFVIYAFLQISASGPGIFSELSNEDGFIGFYFLILSTILDVIFFPLITLFIIQFWEFTIKLFGKLLGDDEDLDDKAKSIMAVTLSSNIFLMIPIVGGIAQKISSLILMYAGLRRQLNASAALSVCIIMFPMFLMLVIFSLMVLVAATRIT